MSTPESVRDGWNPGSRRAHRDQAVRATIASVVMLAVLWWFGASALVQGLVVAAAFGVESWVAWLRRDSVALRAFGAATAVAIVGAVLAQVWSGVTLLVLGAALLVAAVLMRDVYLGGLAIGVAIAAVRTPAQVSDEVGLQVTLALMLAAVIGLLHLGVRRMADEL